MNGRFVIKTKTKNGELSILFTILNDELKIEILEIDMKIKPLKVEFSNGGLIKTKTNFYRAPGIIHEMQLIFENDHYNVSGSLAIAGELEGKAEVFLGKTKQDIMLEELPSYRGKIIKRRSDKEIELEVEKLLGKMTLEEKIGQMYQASGTDTSAVGSNSEVIPIEKLIQEGKTGSLIFIGNNPGKIFYLQKLAVEKSRLGIPLMFAQDVIHGYQTVFPIPLAWSCSFNPELIKEAVRISAKEASAVGLMYAFSPMVDISRDPRWGRVSEGAGEDPFLGAQIAKAQVEGYQGKDFYEKDSMLACLKHFIGYAAAEGGREYNTVEISEATLRNTYVPPFKAGIDAGAASVMNSFNVINGIPVAGNKAILKDLLRGELGFKGITISDFAAVDEIYIHGAAEDKKDAAMKAVTATMDIEMITTSFSTYLPELVKEGKVSEEIVNDAVRRILSSKFKLGIMDDPFKYIRPEDADKLIFSKEHLEKSKELARESIVLLKNNGILPLKKNSKIALIGPCANSKDMLGPWQFSDKGDETVTILEGLTSKEVEIAYAQGCNIDSKIENGFEEALAACKKADIVILALGESSKMSGEAASRQNINLPEVQLELANKIKELGKPIILLLTNGRPLIIKWFDDNMDGIIETWFLGSQAGNAIADVIVGDYNPSGRLTMTFPLNQGQIPIYYNSFNTGRPYTEGNYNPFLSKYIDGPNTPLYPFGYGLSYTSFEYSDMNISSNKMTAEEGIEVSVTVTNTGVFAGTEIVQMYIRDLYGSIVRPVKELKGFKKIFLVAGESKAVSFFIKEESLKFYNSKNEYKAEKGEFEVFVGRSSQETTGMKFEFI
ncbi:beta-glucosidase BglX [Clostridium chromiireducens]|uniref:beta-glucosidase n=1 Tax=Clostridium chromiireducens TaxID=225345 RepID=A0A1V4IRS6_9CLOT|nr:beta-glucosidase BglX [Clostridium chromiireducens]OPJ62520.1 periplasmic beta-glucosidase precursor [Clostridium chromiireducens]